MLADHEGAEMPRFGKKTEEDAIDEAYATDQLVSGTEAPVETHDPWVPDEARDQSDSQPENYFTPEDMAATPPANEKETPMTATATETPAVLDGVTTESKPRRGRPSLADLPEVPEDALGGELEFVPEEEWDSTPLTGRIAPERSAAQMKLDADVKKVHDAWVQAGMPGIRTAPRARRIVKPEFQAATSAMITRAAALHKVKVEKKITHDQNGMAVIVFTAMDRPEPVKKDDKKSE